MPIAYSVERERRWLFAVAEGEAGFSEIATHLRKERDDGGLPFPELIDATRATVALSGAEVRRVVDLLRDLARHGALGPTAVVVGDDVSYGVMRMLEILVEDVCAVRPFRGRLEAEEWLLAAELEASGPNGSGDRSGP